MSLPQLDTPQYNQDTVNHSQSTIILNSVNRSGFLNPLSNTVTIANTFHLTSTQMYFRILTKENIVEILPSMIESHRSEIQISSINFILSDAPISRNYYTNAFKNSSTKENIVAFPHTRITSTIATDFILNETTKNQLLHPKYKILNRRSLILFTIVINFILTETKENTIGIP